MNHKRGNKDNCFSSFNSVTELILCYESITDRENVKFHSFTMANCEDIH